MTTYNPDNSKKFIYFFYDSNDNLLYIGKTINLISRLKCHFSKEVVKVEPWKELVDKDKIIIYECKTCTDLDVYETYFINKYHPEYNKDKVYNDTLTFELPELEPISLKQEYELAKEVVEFFNNNCGNSMIREALFLGSDPNLLCQWGDKLRLTTF